MDEMGLFEFRNGRYSRKEASVHLRHPVTNHLENMPDSFMGVASNPGVSIRTSLFPYFSWSRTRYAETPSAQGFEENLAQ